MKLILFDLIVLVFIVVISEMLNTIFPVEPGNIKSILTAMGTRTITISATVGVAVVLSYRIFYYIESRK